MMACRATSPTHWVVGLSSRTGTRALQQPDGGDFSAPTPSHGLALPFHDLLCVFSKLGRTRLVVTFLSTRGLGAWTWFTLSSLGSSASVSAAPAGVSKWAGACSPLMGTAPVRVADEMEFPAVSSTPVACSARPDEALRPMAQRGVGRVCMHAYMQAAAIRAAQPSGRLLMTCVG